MQQVRGDFQDFPNMVENAIGDPPPPPPPPILIRRKLRRRVRSDLLGGLFNELDTAIPLTLHIYHTVLLTFHFLVLCGCLLIDFIWPESNVDCVVLGDSADQTSSVADFANTTGLSNMKSSIALVGMQFNEVKRYYFNVPVMMIFQFSMIFGCRVVYAHIIRHRAMLYVCCPNRMRCHHTKKEQTEHILHALVGHMNRSRILFFLNTTALFGNVIPVIALEIIFKVLDWRFFSWRYYDFGLRYVTYYWFGYADNVAEPFENLFPTTISETLSGTTVQCTFNLNLFIRVVYLIFWFLYIGMLLINLTLLSCNLVRVTTRGYRRQKYRDFNDRTEFNRAVAPLLMQDEVIDELSFDRFLILLNFEELSPLIVDESDPNNNLADFYEGLNLPD